MKTRRLLKIKILSLVLKMAACFLPNVVFPPEQQCSPEQNGVWPYLGSVKAYFDNYYQQRSNVTTDSPGGPRRQQPAHISHTAGKNDAAKPQ